MSGHGKHMIHRDCIHHGWDNSFKPRITHHSRGDRRVRDAGRLVGSALQDLDGGRAKLDLGRVNAVTGPVFIDGAQPGRRGSR